MPSTKLVGQYLSSLVTRMRCRELVLGKGEYPSGRGGRSLIRQTNKGFPRKHTQSALCVSALKPCQLSGSQADPSASALISPPLGWALLPVPLLLWWPSPGPNPPALFWPCDLVLLLSSACLLLPSDISLGLQLQSPRNKDNSLLPYYNMPPLRLLANSGLGHLSLFYKKNLERRVSLLRHPREAELYSGEGSLDSGTTLPPFKF